MFNFGDEYWTADIIAEAMAILTAQEKIALAIFVQYSSTPAVTPGPKILKDRGMPTLAEYRRLSTLAVQKVKEWFAVRGITSITDLEFEKQGSSSEGNIQHSFKHAIPLTIRGEEEGPVVPVYKKALPLTKRLTDIFRSQPDTEWTTDQIATELNEPRAKVMKTLIKMFSNGIIDRVDLNIYKLHVHADELAASEIIGPDTTDVINSNSEVAVNSVSP